MNKQLEKLKKEISDWSRGLPIEGETKEELRSSLKMVHWSLECELDQQKDEYINRIEKLKIKEC